MNNNIIKINKSYLEENMYDFLEILKDVPHEYWNENNFLQELNGKWSYSLAIEIENRISGYIIASIKESNIHIHKFMIKKELRNQGIGKILLHEFVNNCFHKFDFITLKFYKSNIMAKEFYLKNNFDIFEYNDDLLFGRKSIT